MPADVIEGSILESRDTLSPLLLTVMTAHTNSRATASVGSIKQQKHLNVILSCVLCRMIPTMKGLKDGRTVEETRVGRTFGIEMAQEHTFGLFLAVANGGQADFVSHWIHKTNIKIEKLMSIYQQPRANGNWAYDHPYANRS